MTTYTNMGRFENDSEATVKFMCDGCSHEYVAICRECYVENHPYSYYATKCAKCGTYNQEVS
ncbi:hypothetical protein B7L88_gp117 [Rhizobium phage RHEph10]|uniref:hypothetical protein n=1 Tax=Rhizobium phage RHEph10 TaxID=1220717 RepID=UPI0002AB4490|nr:hypothetical protein B7L88_gp117 [Rhizobium phage RHEph10]AGC36171.1 hypothetical protein RHEph10_gp128 [Rhizobium phage RHEph10]